MDNMTNKLSVGSLVVIWDTHPKYALPGFFATATNREKSMTIYGLKFQLSENFFQGLPEELKWGTYGAIIEIGKNESTRIVLAENKLWHIHIKYLHLSDDYNKIDFNTFI